MRGWNHASEVLYRQLVVEEADEAAQVIAEVASNSDAVTLRLAPANLCQASHLRPRDAEGPLLLPVPDQSPMASHTMASVTSDLAFVLAVPGLIGLDMMDVRTVLLQPGRASLAIGEVTGEGRGAEAAHRAIAALPDAPWRRPDAVDGVFAILTTSSSLKMPELAASIDVIKGYFENDTEIIFGNVFDETVGDIMRVTLVTVGRI